MLYRNNSVIIKFLKKYNSKTIRSPCENETTPITGDGKYNVTAGSYLVFFHLKTRELWMFFFVS